MFFQNGTDCSMTKKLWFDDMMAMRKSFIAHLLQVYSDMNRLLFPAPHRTSISIFNIFWLQTIARQNSCFKYQEAEK